VTPAGRGEIEKLGFGALWVRRALSGQLRFAEPILEVTKKLVVATGASTSGRRRPRLVAQSFHIIKPLTRDRFCLAWASVHHETVGSTATGDV